MMSHCYFVMTWADQILEWFHEAVFLPPPQPSQSGWESLQSILWMYLSWLIGVFTLEKLTSGWSPSASPLLAGPTPLDGLGQLGSFFELFEGFSWQGGQVEATCLIVVWRSVLLKELSSNLWRAYSPKWVVAYKELTNFHWRFPGRKGVPHFGTIPYDLLESPHS